MNRGKRDFIGAKVRQGGVRPTRIDRPLPSSTPGVGREDSRYVMDEGFPDQGEAWHAGMGSDAYPEPMIQHLEVDRNLADFAPADFPNGVLLLSLPLVRGSAADRIRVDWLFSIPEQESVFDVDIRSDGVPFINRRFAKPYNSTYPIEFFRIMNSQTTVQIFVVQKPGTVLVQPLGRFCAWLIVDAYRGKYLG